MPERNEFDIIADIVTKEIAEIPKAFERKTVPFGMEPLSVEQAAKRVQAMQTPEARAAFRELVGMETMKKIAEYIHEHRPKPRMFPERRPNV